MGSASTSSRRSEPSSAGSTGLRQEPADLFGLADVVRGEVRVVRVVVRLAAAGLADPAPLPAAFDAAGFDPAAFEGDRFVVAVLFDAAVLDAAFLEAVLLDVALLDRRVFFVELPPGNAFSTTLPALAAAPATAFPAVVAASPTALPAVVAAPPTTLPALVAAFPTALPGPDAATVPAALLTVPAALPTVFPTFFPALFRSLAVSGINRPPRAPNRRAVVRSMAMQPPC